MYKFRQIFTLAFHNFRGWKRSPQILLAFGLGFTACFLLSDKVVVFATSHNSSLQLFEPFIWTFGDAVSILLVSLCLLLLFADLPNLGNEVPFLLVRTSRLCWMAGQIVYIILATTVYVLFILISTCFLCSVKSYTANLWSDTAAILGYSSIGEEIAVPAFVKVLELSFPYRCTFHIFALVLGYSLTMSSLIFLLNLFKGKLGMIGGVLYSGFGLFLTPDLISKWFRMGQEKRRIANILFGWLSPLNHATYYMHNFGYDNLPRLWQSYLFFAAVSLALFALAFWRVKSYPFNFTGTEK